MENQTPMEIGIFIDFMIYYYIDKNTNLR